MRLGTERPHERCEALSRMPRLAEGPDLVPDHGLVDVKHLPYAGSEQFSRAQPLDPVAPARDRSFRRR